MQVIPLELLPAGEFDLIYRAPLDPRSGELPVLPLSITGAVAMANAADNEATSDGYVAADTFFIMKFDKQQVRFLTTVARMHSYHHYLIAVMACRSPALHHMFSFSQPQASPTGRITMSLYQDTGMH